MGGIMRARSPFPYRFHTYEPALFVEFYLPKKAKYQGVLYTSLTEGFNIDSVKKHLKSRGRIRRQINEFLENDALKRYSDARIDQMKRFRWGYSMYEVDGAFWDERIHDTEDERTQIIRMMFRFDLDEMMNHCGISREEYLAQRDLIRDSFETNRTGRMALVGNRHNRQEVAIIKYIDHWVDDIALFVFGYLLFRICLEVSEKEIWITSFGNLQLNRVTPHDPHHTEEPREPPDAHGKGRA
jgi:hypothetical protein